MTRVLKYLAEEYEFLAHIKSKYIGAMIYPSMLFAVAIGAVFLLFTQILPNIFELVTAFPDIKLPATTLFIRNMTNFMVENTVAIIVTVIIV
ncbi:type II secretion system F family protein [Patescibacteria group bacterium]|nr:type II secretion system F family protein [Patescibacteria group bacterium]